MTTLTHASRRSAVSALALILGSAAVAWLLFTAGQYVDLVTTAGVVWDPDEPEQVRFAHYFTVAALVVLGIGALAAKRRLAKLRAQAEPRSALVDSVSQFSSIMLIVAAALSTWAVFMLFMDGFFTGSEPAPLARVVNLYLPIVIYTALVVVLLLVGFVFSPAPAQVAKAQMETAVDPAAPAPTQTDSAAQAADAQQPYEAQPSQGSAQRSTAFAYAVPIVAAAIALVLGLIVYDVTRTALQVWVWVAILVIVGAGLLAGTVFARRAHAHAPSPHVVAGAKILNFVFSVLFTVIVAGMSLTYGTSAVRDLSVWPQLSMDAFSDMSGDVQQNNGVDEAQDPSWNLWGSDLLRGSEATVTLEPGGEVIATGRVDQSRWVSADGRLPQGVQPGDYAVIARGTAADGEAVEVTMPITVVANGLVLFPEGTYVAHDIDDPKLLPATGGWFVRELLPAVLLLVLSLGVAATTMTNRNRDSE